MSRSAKTKALRTTVTYLELTGPARGHHPLPVNIHAALMRTERIPLHYYRYLQYRTGRDYHWVYRLRMDDETLRAVVHDSDTRVDVLYIDGAPAGFFELHKEDGGAIDLAYFGLMAHAHGRGVGKWLLGQAIDTAWSMDAARVTVNTCTLDHPAALPLYQKLGFSPTGQSETFIHPLEDKDHVRLAAL